MVSHARHDSVHVDRDGVRTITSRRPRRVLWLVALAIGLPIIATIVAVAIVRVEITPPTQRSTTVSGTNRGAAGASDSGGASHNGAGVAPAVGASGDAGAAAAPAAGAPAAPARRVTPRRAARTELPRGADAEEKAMPEIQARDVIPYLRESGEREGIAVFPLPGTDPIKTGLVVPEDFELPEGYVRHYQTTDDGRRLPAILMVHPEYELVDDHGASVAVSDRIVPRDLAPPGLPIQMLEPPETEKSGARPAP